MKTWLRGALAVLLGVVVGSAVNMGIVIVGGELIPLPAGIDPARAESLAEHADLLEPRHFVAPWLAHALGTFAGAAVAALVAARHALWFGIGIGAFFELGGIAAATMIPAPLAFLVLDLSLAYLPMGALAGWLVGRYHAAPDA